MRDEIGRGEPVYLATEDLLEIYGATDRELADWIISFSLDTRPESVADTIRARLNDA